MILTHRFSLTILLSLVVFLIAACGAGQTSESAASQAAPQVAAPQPAAPAAPAPTARPPLQVTGPAAAAVPTPEPTAAPVAKPAEDSVVPSTERHDPVAAELTGITGWINSEPFTIESLRGKVVLIDFWTYTCINCIRTLPYLKEWHTKYADEGLVIIGVHTPEFEFEKNKDNVVQASIKHMLEYAIAQDNDFATWRAYNNMFWPAKYLIDKDGYIVYTHFGEGAYEETEMKIRELLAAAGSSIDKISLEVKPEPERDPLARASGEFMTSQTRELYAGFERNMSAYQSGEMPPYVFHEIYYRQPNVELLYTDPGDHNNHFIYVQGLWHNGLESLTHARETEKYDDYLAVKFYGTTVNVVMSPEGGAPYEVRVTMDGAPLKPEDAGSDIRFDDDGNSYVLVDKAEMFRIVKLSVFGGHALKLSSNSADFSVFAYTFGSYKTDPES